MSDIAPTTEADTVEAPEGSEVLDLDDFDFEGLGDTLDDTAEGGDETYTVTIDGKQVEVTLDEALQGYQRQADYTRKTQELAQYRQALQPLEQLAVALDKNPAQTLQLLAKDLGVELAVKVAEAAAQVDPATQDPLAETVSALQARLDAQEQAAKLQQARNEIVRDLTDLQQQHGDFDADALLDYAADHRIQDLNVAFAAWQYSQAQGDPREAIVERKRNLAVEDRPGRSTSGHAPGAGGKMNLRQSLRAAVKEHRG